MGIIFYLEVCRNIFILNFSPFVLSFKPTMKQAAAIHPSNRTTSHPSIHKAHWKSASPTKRTLTPFQSLPIHTRYYQLPTPTAGSCRLVVPPELKEYSRKGKDPSKIPYIHRRRSRIGNIFAHEHFKVIRSVEPKT